MTVGEVFLSAFLQVLFDRLAPRELFHFAGQDEIRLELNKWSKKLLMIQAVLNDAEEKQLTDRAVKIWLDDVRDLTYDVEDILDEIATEALEQKLVSEQDRKNFFPTCFNGLNTIAMLFNDTRGSRIKDVSSRLEELCEQRFDLGLEKTAGRTSSALWRRPPSTSLPTEPAVFGRDEDKTKVLEMMSTNKSSSTANFDVISIVGMGGVGKTTLARLVYNDEAVEDFQRKAWVCVSDSDNFDVFRITKSILESITFSCCDLKDLNQVQIQLKKAITGRKFLLVLDDVWSKNYGLWETLKSPLMAGAPGSKIILTTRNVDVALTTGSVECYNLKLLSDDDCWSLFVKHAFTSKDTSAHSNLKLIQNRVIEKCGGLPLAARTLGGLLRSNRRYDEWEDILKRNIWDLSDDGELAATLNLSYYHLPSNLKRCFAYCAILPKDYEFEEKELVFLWVAEGFIQQSEGNKQLEDLGGEYFRDLLSRSIFQPSSSNSSKFVMHNLINDLAQRISGETIFTLESDELKANKQSRSMQKVRHSSYSCGYCDGKNKFEIFHEVRCLRTFMPVTLDDDEPHYITNAVISDLLPKFLKLRVLSLKGYYITELPDSIGDLRYLRYLNLSNTKIKSLPDSTGLLFNLQILILNNCSCLMKLPSNIENLVSLRHLDITGVNLNTEMPPGMKELKYLQTLSNFIVGKDTECGLKILKNLKFLRGELCISRLTNVTNSHDIREVILSDKKNLKILVLEWDSQFDDSRDKVVERNVLAVLQPHKNLKELTIKCYGGISFPSWLENPLFSNIVVLRLESCEKCTSLPSFGVLSSLKYLTIKGMKELKSIGCEIYGENCSKPFQSLETLSFEDLQGWEHWRPTNENKNVERFPCLQKLTIVRCPKLIGSLPEHLPSLEKLMIHKCARLMVSFLGFPMLCQLEIDGCKGLVCRSPTKSKSLNSMTISNISEFGNWLKQGFQAVERLRIVNCEELINLWQNEICPQRPQQGLHSLTSLKELCIEDCSSLISFPDACFLSILCELEINNCTALRSLPDGIKHSNAYLKSLRIEGCHSLTFIVKGQLPPSLKEISIINCEKLRFLLDDEEGTCSSSSSSSLVMQKVNSCNINTSLLQYLYVYDCPSLMCLSVGGELPGTLKHLEIGRCSELRTLSLRGQLPSTLTHLEICDCSKLESIAEKFHGNTSLGYILIGDCENLRSLPEGLHNLKLLCQIHIRNCRSLVSLPEGGLPETLTNLSVSFQRCERLEALPTHMHNLNSLQKLTIWQCPSITSLPEEGFPTHLTSLSIEDLNIYKSLFEWGLHKLISLKHLKIGGWPDAISFPYEEMGMTLPASLTKLAIGRFLELKFLSSTGFQNLTSLEYLCISDCPKLTSLPQEGLPSSLLQLYVNGCPLLKKQCKRDKGQEWSKIAHIPCVELDGRFIYDLEEEEKAVPDPKNLPDPRNKKEGRIRELYIQYGQFIRGSN